MAPALRVRGPAAARRPCGRDEAEVKIRRRHLRRMPRHELERFARWLRLRSAPAWSDRHLAALVYWRITRETARH